MTRFANQTEERRLRPVGFYQPGSDMAHARWPLPLLRIEVGGTPPLAIEDHAPDGELAEFEGQHPPLHEGSDEVTVSRVFQDTATNRRAIRRAIARATAGAEVHRHRYRGKTEDFAFIRRGLNETQVLRLALCEVTLGGDAYGVCLALDSVVIDDEPSSADEFCAMTGQALMRDSPSAHAWNGIPKAAWDRLAGQWAILSPRARKALAEGRSFGVATYARTPTDPARTTLRVEERDDAHGISVMTEEFVQAKWEGACARILTDLARLGGWTSSASGIGSWHSDFKTRAVHYKIEAASHWTKVAAPTRSRTIAAAQSRAVAGPAPTAAAIAAIRRMLARNRASAEAIVSFEKRVKEIAP